MYENSILNDVIHLSVEQFEQAASSLNVGSAVEMFGLSVECILFLHRVIYLHLKALYNACIRLGYVPVSFKIGMIIRVLKVKVTSVMSCEQFRPITIFPILFKVLEFCIINCCKESLITHLNQFAYKKSGDCEKAVFYINSVKNHLMQHNSNVFVTTLDARAAFDGINIYGMLSKLMKLNVNFGIVCILLSWYTKFGA